MGKRQIFQRGALAMTVLLCLCDPSVLGTAGNKMNVLFLVADDMRPELGCYDGQDAPSHVHPKMYTPNLDKLASRSLLLKRAYVQQAVCSPSRTSFLTSRRPDTTHVYDLYNYFRDVGGNYTTLPEYFKYHGYVTAGFGKVFHPGHASGHDDPPSWTEPFYHAPNLELWSSVSKQASASWLDVPKSVTDKEPLPDNQLAESAMNFLDKVSGKPFFVAVGFHKPHLPFVFPAEFIKHYPPENVHLPPNPYAPVDMPPIAWHNYYTGTQIGRYTDTAYSNATGKINTTMDDVLVLNLRRAYYSAISYTDSLVGKVVEKIDQLGLSSRTIIPFLGDHGWQLGEHGEWCKQTNFELATHTPMMLHIPGKTEKGIEMEKLTEMVDLYPTIVEAAGLPPLDLCPEGNTTKVNLCREGTSMMSLIDNATAPWKTAAFSQYPRTAPNGDSVMGYTMRTDQFRYTEWPQFKGKPEYKPNWSVLYGVELYDHKIDPEENVNRANDASYKEIRSQLSKMLHDGWRKIPIK